jgi:type II secretory pathway predicted ATPase ExeA
LSLLAEPGTGKTLLLRHLFDNPPLRVRPLLLLHPEATFDEIVEWVAGELGVWVEDGDDTKLAALRAAVATAAAGGENIALLIDEAQALPLATLTAVPELLVPLEGDGSGLQVVLAGQPALARNLAEARLRDRIKVRAWLGPLTPTEIGGYIHESLARAGAGEREVLSAEAVSSVARLTHGVPRLVNTICEASLAVAVAARSRTVTAEHVKAAWAEILEFGAAPAPSAAPAGTVAAPTAPAAPAAAEAAREAPRPAAAPPPRPRVPRPRPPAAPPRSARSPWPLVIPAAAVAMVLLVVAITRIGAPPRTVPLPAGGQVRRAVAVASPAAPATPPPTPAEALDVIDAYRRAYEARDGARLSGLLAPEAAEAGHVGSFDVAAAKAVHLDDVVYEQPSARLEPRGEAMEVRAPFVIRYRERAGHRGELRGTSVWQIARREGALRVVALRREMAPGSMLPGDTETP